MISRFTGITDDFFFYLFNQTYSHFQIVIASVHHVIIVYVCYRLIHNIASESKLKAFVEKSVCSTSSPSYLCLPWLQLKQNEKGFDQ